MGYLDEIMSGPNSDSYLNSIVNNSSFKRTELSPREEKQFQEWIKALPWYSEFVKDWKEEPDLNTPLYDYRGAWKLGIVPERNKYDKNRYHWADVAPNGRILKSPEHPTAWMESFMQKFGYDPQSKGITKDQYEKMLK